MQASGACGTIRTWNFAVGNSIPQDYVFTQHLLRGAMGVEFLRRNPDLPGGWSVFDAVWRELEAEYGAPPNRDFCAWKLDSRAWRECRRFRAIAGSTGTRC